MKFTVIAVGKLKERFWTEACAEYLKRLQPYAKTEVREIADVDPRRAGGVEGARDKEGAAICAELDKLGPDVHVALLAIDGKERSSVGISQRIDSLALAGKSSFAFVIGGSDGVSAEVRARADELLSFGPITLPHNLARVVLLEQLYRAQKISHGEPYQQVDGRPREGGQPSVELRFRALRELSAYASSPLPAPEATADRATRYVDTR